MLKKFISFIEENGLFQKNDRLLVACSGGVDSVVLCHLLYSNAYPFSIAHGNFQLRGEDSSRDEAFVRMLGEKYEVPVYVQRFETVEFSQVNKISIQVACRELRYQWFYDLLDKENLNFLVTAHHADDNVETVLMNLFKGTGINGMHGILPKREKLVRPMLFATKNEILTYAKEQNLSWVEDSSNASDKYTRNFFRHQVIPLVEKVVPNAAANMLQTIAQMKEAEILYSQGISGYKKKLLVGKGAEIHIPVLKFAAVKPFNTIAYEIIKPYGFTASQLPDLLSLMQGDTGKYIASASHRIIKNRKWLIIAPLAANAAANVLIEADDELIEFEGGKLQLRVSGNVQPSNDATMATLDAKYIHFPLLLRRWKAGDYFYPLGMPKKKKIARFLIDLKLSKTDKEKVWVIECRQKIIWVVGYRIDDRFKITPATKEVVRFKLVG